MRVLISGGGTGGHINPALAIAGKIKSECPDAVIEYVGTSRGLETTLVPREGYKLHLVKVRGFKRKLCKENLVAAKEAITSVFEAKRIIKQFKPDIVIGTGGYVCWPVLKAAASMKIPTAVHEQNAVVGMTVKMLSRYVDKVMMSFSASEYAFQDKSKLVLTGNPIKEEMLSFSKSEERKKFGVDEDTPLILSYGGSLGARVVNENCYEVIKSFSEKAKVCHIHATGKGGFPRAKEMFLERGYKEIEDGVIQKGNVTIREYIYNMPSLISAADILICRAGAMTLSEISAVGKAAIIIPSPNVTNNHQYKNAKIFEDANACILIEENKLNCEVLKDSLEQLCTNKEKRNALENNVKQFAIVDSLDRIWNVIKDLLNDRG